MRCRLPQALLLAGLLACSSEPAGDEPDAGDLADAEVEADLAPTLVEPASGPSFGHFQILIHVQSAGLDAQDVDAVTVGGIAAYSLAIAPDGRLSAVVQGADDPGPAPVVVVTPAGEIEVGALDYQPPLDPVFDRVVALGASLTQGVQRGVPSFHGALAGPATHLARQAGAYFPLPLLKPGLFPQVTTADIGPPPDCTTPNILEFIRARAADVAPSLQDPLTGRFGYQHARVDPLLEVHNVAVGGSLIGDVLRGPASDNLGGNFVSHLVYDPFGAFLSPVSSSQMDAMARLEPTLIVSVDLFGNDVIGAFFLGETVDVALATPAAALTADIDAAVDRLAQTGAEVFLANLPRPSILPSAGDRARRMTADGSEDVDARMRAVDELAEIGNAALKAAADRFDNVYIVDFAAGLDVLAGTELDLAGERLTTAKFGGLVGLDGVHLSDTGYALLGNLLIDTVNAELGTSVPRVDLDAVAAEDVERPSALRAEGLDVEACE